MTRTAILAALSACLALPAHAEGRLNIFNFGLYTPPELLEQFSAETGVEVTLTEFAANEEAIARIQAGGHGLDVVVVSAYYIPVYLEQGLLLESRPDQMANFANVAPDFRSVTGDPDRHYTAPWVWGTTGVMVNTARYSGDINTAAIFLDPPDELRGQVNLVPQMNDTIDMTLRYLGAETCTSDREALREARDLLLAAKPHWASVDYPSFEKFVNEDLNASIFWSGAAGRIREANPGFAYGWPATGYMQWTDNAAILADATNVENARLFLDYIMAPENAALISNYTRYGNAITGSEAFMDPGLLDSPELTIPAELVGAAIDQRLCPPEVQELYSRIWTEVMR